MVTPVTPTTVVCHTMEHKTEPLTSVTLFVKYLTSEISEFPHQLGRLAQSLTIIIDNHY